MTDPIQQAPTIQGWCPGALRPMMSGDGLVLRIRPVAARLTQSQALGLADLSRRFGNGLIDFSSRGNVQLRGVSTQGHSDLIAALAALGLVDETPKAEAQRNITVSPFWTQQDQTVDVSAQVVKVMSQREAPVLPSKFGVAIDLGPTPVLQDISADIRVERDAEGSLLLVANGMARGMTCHIDHIADHLQKLAAWFVAAGGVTGGRGRMARLIANGTVPDGFDQTPRQVQDPATRFVPSVVLVGAMVGFDFGQTDWKTLTALAEIGPLRITPWRMIIVEGARQMPHVAGLITDPQDPMLWVTACTGKPGCLQALQPTRPLGRALAPHLQGPLHVSGCTKGCAHPKAAEMTLVATATGFDFIRQGRADDTPTLRSLTAADLCAHPNLLSAKEPNAQPDALRYPMNERL
ncbi:MAG: precorrin-3B synthase [Microgenomates group bacterium]